MKDLDAVAAMMLVVGGLSWGSIALGGPDLVAMMLGDGSGLSRAAYGVFGLSALWQVAQWQGIQKRRPSRWPGLFAAALLALFAVGSLEAQAAPAMSATAMKAEPATVVDAAVAAGDFKTLVAAVQAADLVPTLSGKGPFTVFAPTDAAFAKLPEGTVPGLLKDKAKLTVILTYHVVPGRLTAADLKAKADKDGYVTLKTVNGADLKIHFAGSTVHVGDKQAVVTGADVAAKNGIIHVIDAVLMP